jgi:hypothetical protein
VCISAVAHELFAGGDAHVCVVMSHTMVAQSVLALQVTPPEELELLELLLLPLLLELLLEELELLLDAWPLDELLDVELLLEPVLDVELLLLDVDVLVEVDVLVDVELPDVELLPDDVELLDGEPVLEVELLLDAAAPPVPPAPPKPTGPPPPHPTLAQVASGNMIARPANQTLDDCKTTSLRRVPSVGGGLIRVNATHHHEVGLFGVGPYPTRGARRPREACRQRSGALRRRRGVLSRSLRAADPGAAPRRDRGHHARA